MHSMAKALFYIWICVFCGNTLAESLNWKPPVDLTFDVPPGDDPRLADSPQIALSSDGSRATSIWRRSSELGHFIESTSATISGNRANWGKTKLVSTPSLDPDIEYQDSRNQQISLSSDGTRATAIWVLIERNPGGSLTYAIYSKSATIEGNTATWGSAEELDLGINASDPQIALSSDGTKATAIWHRSNGSNSIILSKSATIVGNTATWGSNSILSIAGKNAFASQLSLSTDGTKVTAVWVRVGNSSDRIIQSVSASITGNSATWSSPVDLSSIGGLPTDPQIAISSDGTMATALWKQYKQFDQTKYTIRGASATIVGNMATWSSATVISKDGIGVDTPQISISKDGTKATAVWQNKSTGSTYFIQSASATINGNTSVWGLAVDLSATGSASNPQIALSSGGTIATAVWTYNGATPIIQSASATISGNTGAWTPPVDLSTTGQNSVTPQVALSANGDKATSVWRRYNGSLSSIIQSASAASEGQYFIIKSTNGNTVIIPF